jgi:hypothetical protein
MELLLLGQTLFVIGVLKTSRHSLSGSVKLCVSPALKKQSQIGKVVGNVEDIEEAG